MKYEVWKHEDKHTEHYYLMPVDHQYEAFVRYRAAYEPDSVLIWSFEAETREEANARYREYMYGESTEPTSGE